MNRWCVVEFCVVCITLHCHLWELPVSAPLSAHLMNNMISFFRRDCQSSWPSTRPESSLDFSACASKTLAKRSHSTRAASLLSCARGILICCAWTLQCRTPHLSQRHSLLPSVRNFVRHTLACVSTPSSASTKDSFSSCRHRRKAECFCQSNHGSKGLPLALVLFFSMSKVTLRQDEPREPKHASHS